MKHITASGRVHIANASYNVQLMCNWCAIDGLFLCNKPTVRTWYRNIISRARRVMKGFGFSICSGVIQSEGTRIGTRGVHDAAVAFLLPDANVVALGGQVTRLSVHEVEGCQSAFATCVVLEASVRLSRGGTGKSISRENSDEMLINRFAQLTGITQQWPLCLKSNQPIASITRNLCDFDFPLAGCIACRELKVESCRVGRFRTQVDVNWKRVEVNVKWFQLQEVFFQNCHIFY